MFCTSCGARNTPDSRFCAECGAPISRPDSEGLGFSPPVPFSAQPTAQAPYPPPLWIAPPSNPYGTPFLVEPKSFTTPAVITMVLYIVLWLPGLIANILYLNEAKGVQRRTGREPEGMGCLWALLIVFTILPILGVCAFIGLAAAGGSSS
jgi:hypothetical protein